MKYHFPTVAILLCAVALYVVGASEGGSLFLFLGAVLECWFWIRALRGRHPAAFAAPPAKR